VAIKENAERKGKGKRTGKKGKKFKKQIKTVKKVFKTSRLPGSPF